MENTVQFVTIEDTAQQGTWNNNDSASLLFEQESDDSHPLSEEENKQYGVDMQRLRLAHLIAGTLHLCAFFLWLILTLVNPKRVFIASITRTFTEWNGGVPAPKLRLIGTYKLSWTVLPFSLITALFHYAIASPLLFPHYSRIVLHRGKCGRAGWNWVRWTEYSITASMMTWSIAQLSGITDLPTLFFLVALNVCTQLFGGLGHELLNFGWQRHGSKEPAKWWLFGIAFVPFVASWAVIFAAFVIQALSAPPPVFVWVLVFSMFFGFSLFTVPILLHYTRFQSFLASSNIGYELFFVALSLLVKVAMDAVVVGGSFSV